jgi:hypothetical protein
MRTALVALLLVGKLASANERTAAQLTVSPGTGKAPVEVWVTRARDGAAGVVVKLIAKGVGPKAQALTLHRGDGDDDGPGDASLKSVSATPFELGGGAQAVRVDLVFLSTGGGPRDTETQTLLIGFEGRTHKLFTLETRRARDRSKVCREISETALATDAAANLVATTRRRTIQIYGEDDQPIDKSCVAPAEATTATFKWAGDRFAGGDEQASPSSEQD